jgi:hypothetical protein
MELKNIVLFIGSIIFLLEFILPQNKNLFLYIVIGFVVINLVLLLRNVQKNPPNDIGEIGRVIKVLAVQVGVAYVYFLNHTKINNEVHNRNIYYLLILNIVLVGICEFIDYKDFNSKADIDKKFFLRIINGIMLFLVAYLVPAPSMFGIYDGLYGFKDNLLWIIIFVVFLLNYYLGNRKYDDELKYVILVLVALIVPLFAHLIQDNRFLLYRCVFISIGFALLEYDPRFFYNSYEEKIKDFYLKNEYSFIVASALIGLAVFQKLKNNNSKKLM